MSRLRIRRTNKDVLNVEEVVAWALTHYKRTGQWPTGRSGPIPDAPDVTWQAIEAAVRGGYRGMPECGTLARFLDEFLEEARKQTRRPKLSLSKIERWAAQHHQRSGLWPTNKSGDIPESPGDTWMSVNKALIRGTRGLNGGTTLAKALKKTRGSIRKLVREPLTIKQIETWARRHYDEFGTWPSIRSGAVFCAPREKWPNIHQAPMMGGRGLPGGTTLSQLLRRQTGSGPRLRLPRLTVQLVLACADEFRRRHGKWPDQDSGPVDGLPGETWRKVQSAFHTGERGLPVGSLARTLRRYRGVACDTRNRAPLTVTQILAWADAYHARHFCWPTTRSGAVLGVVNEDWLRISNSLNEGTRGLPGGSSLLRLLAEERGVPHPKEGMNPRIKRYGRYGRGMTRRERELRKWAKG